MTEKAEGDQSPPKDVKEPDEPEEEEERGELVIQCS